MSICSTNRPLMHNQTKHAYTKYSHFEYCEQVVYQEIEIQAEKEIPQVSMTITNIVIKPFFHQWSKGIRNVSLLPDNLKSNQNLGKCTGYLKCQLVAKTQCLQRDKLIIPECNQNMTSLSGQASRAKMMLLRGKQTALACHLTKFVNKAP